MKLTIITINLNNKNGLEQTIKSVVDQTFTDYEYIIIDGGSIDGSKDVILKYIDKINFWISEKDNGIYNAMNKGIKVAKGDYCFFLNSGDYLVNENVLFDIFKESTCKDILSGNVLKVRPNGKWNRVCSHEKISLHRLMIMSLPHQASFIKRNLFDKIGIYTEKYKIVSDWEFFLKALILYDSNYQYFDIDISYFKLDGISSQKKMSSPLAKKESCECIENLFPRMKDDLIEYRYFFNSNIGAIISMIIKNKKLYNFLDKVFGYIINAKKILYGK